MTSKTPQKIFACSKCGAQALKWNGRCLECGAWGTLVEDLATAKKENAALPSKKSLTFDEIEGRDEARQGTGILEFDRVLGGGIVRGSLTLLGGEPGIGKSTLVLQIIASLHEALAKHAPALYVSGEESGEQVKMRLDRLGLAPKGLRFLSETDTDTILGTIEKEKPCFAVIDSIQTCATGEIPGGAGSVSQIRASTVRFLEMAKRLGIPTLLIGHVTKEGEVAGPKTLEHLVDTVLYLEGDRYQTYRILRTIKNRFGSTGEVGVFEMTERGLKEVRNPSLAFLENQHTPLPGTAFTCIVEGSRPLVLEIQALVNQTRFGNPQRRSEGFPLNRLQLLLAVLTQKARLPLGDYDVYLKVAGGLKISDPAADLAAALAILSALKDTPLPKSSAALGEIGLGGDLRSVMQAQERLKEIENLGFQKILIPETLKARGGKAELLPYRFLWDVVRSFPDFKK